MPKTSTNAVTPRAPALQNATLTRRRIAARRRRWCSRRSLTSNGTTWSATPPGRLGAGILALSLLRPESISIGLRLIENGERPQSGHGANQLVAGQDPEPLVHAVVVQVGHHGRRCVLVSEFDGGMSLWVLARESPSREVRDDAACAVRSREQGLLGALSGHTSLGRGAIGARPRARPRSPRRRSCCGESPRSASYRPQTTAEPGSGGLSTWPGGRRSHSSWLRHWPASSARPRRCSAAPGGSLLKSTDASVREAGAATSQRQAGMR